MDAQQVHYLYLVVEAVGRQEEYLLTAGTGRINDVGQFAHGGVVLHAHALGHLADALHRAVPYNIVDVYLVAHQIFDVVVHVDDAYQTVSLQTEVVEERAVLTKLVCVGRIIGWRIIVAEQENEAAPHKLSELFAALRISSCAEHFAVNIMLLAKLIIISHSQMLLRHGLLFAGAGSENRKSYHPRRREKAGEAAAPKSGKRYNMHTSAAPERVIRTPSNYLIISPRGRPKLCLRCFEIPQM